MTTNIQIPTTFETIKEVITRISNKFTSPFHIVGGSALDAKLNMEFKDIDVYINVNDLNVQGNPYDYVESVFKLKYDGNYTIPGVIGKTAIKIGDKIVGMDVIVYDMPVLDYMEFAFDMANKMIAISNDGEFITSRHHDTAMRGGYVSFNYGEMSLPSYREIVRMNEAANKYNLALESKFALVPITNYLAPFKYAGEQRYDTAESFESLSNEVKRVADLLIEKGASNAFLKRLTIEFGDNNMNFKVFNVDVDSVVENKYGSLLCDGIYQFESNRFEVALASFIKDNIYVALDLTPSLYIKKGKRTSYIDYSKKDYIALAAGLSVKIGIGEKKGNMICVDEVAYASVEYVGYHTFENKNDNMQYADRFVFNFPCGRPTLFVEVCRGYTGKDNGYSDDLQKWEFIRVNEGSFEDSF